ncbi:MAG: glycerol kinase GlpK [Planctomycetota bacterium]
MPHLLALDQGTTSSRAIVFDESGHALASAQKEFTQHFPRPGWVEHDAEEIWSTQAGVATEALARAGLSGRDLAAVGIANQRETTVLWERATGRPVHHAIVWQDRRTAPLCERLAADGLTDTFAAKTGLVLDAYFSGTKLAWLLDHVDGARQRAERGELCFGTVDTWLAYRLTNGVVHATDASNASRTLLYNLHTGDWDDELLNLLNVPRSVLPEVRNTGGVYGEITDAGFAEAVPLAAMVGDQQAATFGQLCVEPGMAKNTYGTGCFLLMNVGNQPQPSDHRLLSTVAWQRRGQTTFALEGSVFVGGALVQWLRDGLGIISNAAEIETLAASVPDAGGVVLVPALTGLGPPHWDPHARGTVLGLTRGTTAAHLARAALEGIAFQVADVADAMQADAKAPLSELRVDGGAAANDLLLQTQADLLGVPVVRPTQLETTALGAAYLAGLAVGIWSSVDELAGHWQADRAFEPRISADEAETRRARWRRAVERAGDWAKD